MRTIALLLLFACTIGVCVTGAASRLPRFNVERWVNTPPLTADALRGKVVLIDVWEYTCINWIRTAPYVKAWHRDYAGLGLVVIGLHAPEFAFGKLPSTSIAGFANTRSPIPSPSTTTSLSGVRSATTPGRRSISSTRRVNWSRAGLERDATTRSRPRSGGCWSRPGPESSCRATAQRRRPSQEPASPPTPESPARPTSGRTAGSPVRHLKGGWRNARQYVELRSGEGQIVLPFVAGEVNLVMQPAASGVATLTVLLDGKPVGKAAGADVGTDSAVARSIDPGCSASSPAPPAASTC